MTAEEALLRRLSELAVKGNNAAGRALEQIREARDENRVREDPMDVDVEIDAVRPGSVTEALEHLLMARKLGRGRPGERLAIEPWLVEAALARLGDRRLTLEEQEIVVRATRTPKKVRWPDWWEAMPE